MREVRAVLHLHNRVFSQIEVVKPCQRGAPTNARDVVVREAKESHAEGRGQNLTSWRVVTASRLAMAPMRLNACV
jgi:hypothetical protein